MPSSSNSRILKFAFILLSLAASIFLFIDTFLSFYNLTICPTVACKIAENYLIFDSYILTSLGGIFFLSLVFVYFLYDKKKGYYEFILWLLILSALAFDGVLVGYLFKTKTFCILCLAVASLILFCLISFSCISKNYKSILVGVFIWISSFSAINILNLKKDIKTIPKLEDSVMIHVPAKKHARFYAHLFVSLHCIHCIDVLYNLSKKDGFDNIDWKIHFVGGSEQDYQKVAYMLKDPKIKTEPFKVIIKYILEQKLNKIKYDRDIEKKFKSANHYFKYMGFRGIPLLKVKFDIYDVIVLGDRNIGRFLLEKKIVDKWYLIK